MNLKQAVGYRWLARWPVIGKYILRKIDMVMLVELQAIEARFASPSVRFVNQINDLYDCLKELQLPLAVDPIEFHNLSLGVQSLSSGSIAGLLARVKDNERMNLDEYFSKGPGYRVVTFLDWYSTEETVNLFVQDVSWLVGLYCSRNKRSAESEEDIPIKSNESLDKLVTSRWFKVLVTDLIQVLTVILHQRIGG